MSPSPAIVDRAPEGPVIAVAIEGSDWTAALPAVRAGCRRAALAALHGAQVRARDRLEISILLTDDAVIRTLNRDHRGRDRATNVLSFPGVDATTLQKDATQGGTVGRPAPILLGDVVVAFETVAAEAAAQGKILADHLSHLIAHGVLHLLGYDHETNDEARRMERLETGILADLGVADPNGADPLEDVIGDERPFRIK